ncbi:AMP-binding protein [Amnibacterium kyonggiense]|uniref:O-succinylbenzoic acid--CoA ligase n=1 Tax=Amnibacterium kyonggiense TaxID=595671 RepID=A0A4R7FPG8_9MICO|nr:AMP-binding protein [Amnibacterium kyonggiense]TDS79647.1 O-succinylbenzoic acid--CoA ligase [Amnibacterium kyonggiense]
MRDLAVVPDDPAPLIPAVRAALDGSGPAILPIAPGGDAAGVPRQVPLPVAVVVRTSGSSGVPKSVALSAGALLASAAATESALGGPGEWVLALPGHYIAGIQVIVRAIAAETEPVGLPAGPFTAAAFAAAVLGLPADRRRCTALVPTQLHRVVEAAEAGDPTVREAIRALDAVLIGGGRLPAELAERAAAVGVRVRRTYGASETAGGCVYDGVPLAGVDVRIVDGEVQLAGPVLAEGYLGDPERTEAVFVQDPGRRWYRTGDAGTWDGERLTITGRLDDVVITGGEKVSLGLVEQVVQSLPGLGAALVVRGSDPEWGEVPVVVATAQADLESVRAAVRGSLGRAAAPRRLVVVPEIPLLASGKPDRVALAALAAG